MHFILLGLERYLIEQHEEEEVEGVVGSEVSAIPDPLMALIPGGNGSLSGTVAVTERKYTVLFLGGVGFMGVLQHVILAIGEVCHYFIKQECSS